LRTSTSWCDLIDAPAINALVSVASRGFLAIDADVDHEYRVAPREAGRVERFNAPAHLTT
jgi:hypothetical protein